MVSPRSKSNNYVTTKRVIKARTVQKRKSMANSDLPTDSEFGYNPQNGILNMLRIKNEESVEIRLDLLKQ
jgi:hypothetical protein